MDTVKVAVRIRPLSESEIIKGSTSCFQKTAMSPQIKSGTNLFTFDYVFDQRDGHSEVYDTSVKNLIGNLFNGYNLTILAYGQTGSGKTYTMGTNYNNSGEQGVIPRAVNDIFSTIRSTPDSNIVVSVSFLELYNEAFYDLLKGKTKSESIVQLWEVNGKPQIRGLTEKVVTTAEQAFVFLQQASSLRTVGATHMNTSSSRSHAVFTVNLKITNKKDPREIKYSKFHLVDLAGSERSNKTGATGARFREGVNINKGLLVLGSVISDLARGKNAVCYRNSKLTRFLQDSLGGNSLTLMIVCISPADYNKDESTNTLRYAMNAKKIKNKPVINLDATFIDQSIVRRQNDNAAGAAMIFQLQSKIEELQGIIDSTLVCPAEHVGLISKLKNLQSKTDVLTDRCMREFSRVATFQRRTAMDHEFERGMIEKLQAVERLLHTRAFVNLRHPLIVQMKAKLREIQLDHGEMRRRRGLMDEHMGMNVEEPKFGEVSLVRDMEQVNIQYRYNSELKRISYQLAKKEDLLKKLEQRTDDLTANPLVLRGDEDARITTLLIHEDFDTVMAKLRGEIELLYDCKRKVLNKIKQATDEYRGIYRGLTGEMAIFEGSHPKIVKAALEANQQLQDALARQRAARMGLNPMPLAENVTLKVTQELELIEKQRTAQKSLDRLIQDSLRISYELADARENVVKLDISEEEKNQLKEKVEYLGREFNSNFYAIDDLKKQIQRRERSLEADGYWRILQSRNDVEWAMKLIFNLVSERVIKSLDMKDILAAAEDRLAEAELLNKELDKELSEIKNRHSNEIAELKHNHRKEVRALKKQLDHSRDHGPRHENDLILMSSARRLIAELMEMRQSDKTYVEGVIFHRYEDVNNSGEGDSQDTTIRPAWVTLNVRDIESLIEFD